MTFFNSSNIGKLLLKSKYDALSFQEDALLEDWRRSHPAYQELYDELHSDSLIREAGLFMESLDVEEQWVKHQQRLKRQQREKIVWISMAASLLIFVAIRGWLYIGEVKNAFVVAPGITFLTPGHGQAELILEDGRSISLDASNRHELLNQGHAYAHHSERKLTYSSQVAHSNGKIEYHTLRVPSSNTFQLQLSDGTSVWLNARSELTYPVDFAADNRSVILKGQGYFEVHPDKDKPFKVEANGMEIDVLGTAFDIQAYENEGSAAVSDGLIRVAHGKSVDLVRKGERIQQVNGVLVKEKADFARLNAWREGYFYFDHDFLEYVLQEMGRWYNLSYEFRVPAQKIRISGTIDFHLSLDESIHILASLSGRNVKIEDRKLIIY